MAGQYSAVLTLTTPARTITLNAASGDTYLVDPTQSSGLDMAPVRANVEDRPQTDGGLVHDAFLGAREITLSGVLYIVSATTEAGAVTARNTLADNLEAALFSILRADGTLQYTPTGGSSQTLTVRCDVACTFPGGFFKQFIFGLAAADPTFA